MKKFVTTFVFAALALLLPAAASAASTQVLRSTTSTLATPVLAGDAVVADAYKPGSVDVLSATPGAQPVRLFHIAGEFSVPVAASGNRVLLRTSSEGGASDLYSGPLAGPLTKLESCPQSSQLVFPPGPALDGDTSIWSGEGCVPSRLKIQFGSLSRIVDASGRPGPLAAAGRFVAWVDADPNANTTVATRRLTVYDAQAGSVAYTVVVPDIQTVQLNSDGTALVAPTDVFHGHGACGHDYPSRVAYYTVADPTLHSVPVTTCREQVALAGGRIAFVRRLSDGTDELALANLDGTAIQPVAHIDAISAFDFDGAHVAWSQERCLDNVILRRAATDTSAPDAAPTCPVHVGAPRRSRDGTLHVAVSCPNGCRPVPGGGRLQGMQLISPHWLHVVGKSRGVTRYTPFVPFSLRAGGRTVVRLPLTASQRAGLRRHPHTSVRLKVLLQHIYLPRIARTTR